MKRKLDDGRELMASYDDLHDFFKQHNIIGRTISDIRPAALDYMIQNMNDIEEPYSSMITCAISTDSQVCMVFTDGSHLEIEFSGDGPIILGFNTADFSKYPLYDGTCYKLSTMFKYCIGYPITDIVFEKSENKMTFHAYRGIDMDADDDGIKEIRFRLKGGTSLIASGSFDWYCLEHFMDIGDPVRVYLRELLNELNDETKTKIFGSRKTPTNMGDDVKRTRNQTMSRGRFQGQTMGRFCCLYKGCQGDA